MQYRDFSVEQFVTDEFFQEWVLKPSEESSEFWESWLQKNPDRKENVQEAILIIKNLNFKKFELEKEELNEIWTNLKLQATEKDYLKSNLQKKINIYQRRYWLKVAASLSFILFTAVYILNRYIDNPDQVVAANYGEIKTVILPDESEVILNANSSISYPKKFKDDIRQVKLKGEAFFNVTKAENAHGPQRFQVITGKLKVEVLGTSFNVKSRRSNIQVVLNSGKVDVEVNDTEDGRRVSMIPGELIDYSEDDQKLIKKRVEVDKYSAWKAEKLVLEETSLLQIMQKLEDHFGIRMTLRDESLGDRKFTGIYPMSDPEILIRSLEAAFRVKFYKTQDGYRIVKRESE